MAFGTRRLTGTMLANRYLVFESARETETTTEFRALDTRTGTSVDLHVLREGVSSASRAARSLEREAIVAAAIQHPNVVVPRDLGTLDDATPFVVTTRHGAEALEDRVCLGGSLAVGDVVRIGLDLLSALASAHDLGIVHGDLRPEHVFLVERDGIVLQTLLAGWGSSAHDGGKARLGFHNLSFVAPEVAEGARATPASDLFAVGAILHLAATGFPPYSAPSASDRLPSRLVRVIVQALQVDPARRYVDARDMLAALEVTRGAFGPAYAKTRPVREDGGAVSEVRARTKSDVVPALRNPSASGTQAIDGFGTVLSAK